MHFPGISCDSVAYALEERMEVTMELLKKHIHRNQVIGRSTMQFTVDEDYNVPDAKPDMLEIIRAHGEVRVQEQRVKGDKCFVRGVVACTVLYIGEEGGLPVQALEVEAPFDELLNLEQDAEGDVVRVQAVLEELSASMIHSRKYALKGLLRLNLTANRLVDVESAVEMPEHGVVEGLERKLKKKSLWSVAVDRQENYRVRESVLLAGNKPEIRSILSKEAAFRNMEFRPQSEQLLLKGELELFVLYCSEDDRLTWVSEELPITATIPISGLREEMVPHITWKMGSCIVTPQEDNDGEVRILDIEVPLELNVMAYEEELCQVMTDVYSVTKQVTPIYQEDVLESLMNKNLYRFRDNARVSIAAGAPPMKSICYAGGEVKVDEVMLQEDGVLVEGVVDAVLYYETEEEARPLACHRAQLPFSQLVEVRGIAADYVDASKRKPGAQENDLLGYVHEVFPGIDQISAVMLDERELELKVAVHLDTLVLEQRKEAFLVGVDEAAFSEEMLAQLPNLVCYFVKPGDDWWSIAKKYLTTIRRIEQYNECSLDAPPVPGSKLLLIRPQC